MAQRKSPPVSKPVVKVVKQVKKSVPAPVQPQQTVHIATPPIPIASSTAPLTHKKSTPKVAQKPDQPQPGDIAYDMLLISLSNEYIDAAYQLGPRVALIGEASDVETYNGLISAGLCCLEAALKVRNLSLEHFVPCLTFA
jgi:hypothetical protein